MEITDILYDKKLKPKEKTEILSKLLSEKTITIDQVVQFAGTSREADRATCIEAIEYVSKSSPEIVTLEAFDFISQRLTDKAPRVKWESARVIGNTAHLFPEHLDKAVKNLIDNSEHPGTVVRWSAAYALSQIIKLRLPINTELIPFAEAVSVREDKNSIRKIYLDALKKSSK